MKYGLKAIQPKRILKDGISFLMLNKLEEFSATKLEGFDVILAESSDLSDLGKIIHFIRSSHTNSLSVIPLIYTGPLKKIPNHYRANLDGCQSFKSVMSQTTRIKLLIDKLRKIKFQDEHSEKDSSALKVLSYIYVRDSKLESYKSRMNWQGYSYPILNLRYKGLEKVNDVLSNLVKEDFLIGVKKDEIHCCTSCDSNYLNFVEVCPSCGSSDLHYEELIHHFRCAYVGKQSDFQNDSGGMTCPKCEKDLKHIGMDYDRPSYIHVCNSCHEEFMEPKMEAVCFDCDEVNSVDVLTKYEINDYVLTDRAKEFLVYYEWEGISPFRDKVTEPKMSFYENYLKALELNPEVKIYNLKIANLRDVNREKLIPEIKEILRFDNHSFYIESFNTILLFGVHPDKSFSNVVEKLVLLIQENLKQKCNVVFEEVELEQDIIKELKA